MSNNKVSEFNGLLQELVACHADISDLLFVPGRRPQVEVYGQLETPAVSEPVLTGERITEFARAIIGENAKLQRDLQETGACDCSHALGINCRFRVNIYRQNGQLAMVMRRLASKIPTLDGLGLPPVFKNIVEERNGLVFVTGATGNGKTTTLAALLNEINAHKKIHVVTLEDPIEFLHPPQQATFSQREMGRDFYHFADGLRSALRQAPKVILVGEIRDRETMEIALTAGETGHLVFATLHTTSADQAIHRILGLFRKDEEQLVRERLAGSLRYVLGQRLVPKITGGRLLITELMGSSLRTREAIEQGEGENRRLHDIIETGSAMGWHSFEQSLMKAFESGQITEQTAMAYCLNKPAMRQRLDISKAQQNARPANQGPKVQMMVVEAAAPAAPPMRQPPETPVMVKPEPKSAPLLSGILNGFF